MRGWILNKNLESYISLMKNEGSNPTILETTDEKSLVMMTANAMAAWMSVGYYFEYA